jgi:hypothetical protein
MWWRILDWDDDSCLYLTISGVSFVARRSPIRSPDQRKGVVKTALKSKEGEYSAYEELLVMVFGIGLKTEREFCRR